MHVAFLFDLVFAYLLIIIAKDIYIMSKYAPRIHINKYKQKC